MKKLSIIMNAIFIAFLLFCNSALSITGSALECTLEDFEDYSSLDDNESYTCSSTEDEDFADNKIILLMKNSTSLNFHDYSKTDFSNLDVNTVEEITEKQKNKIKKKFDLYCKQIKEGITPTQDYSDNLLTTDLSKKTVMDNPNELAKQKIYAEYSKFRQIILLTLNKHSKKNVLSTIKRLEQRDDVLSAEPDYYTHETETVPNDTYYNEQWAADDIDLPLAWDITTGSSDTLVGVIDSGIYGLHPDLSNNINIPLSTGFRSDSLLFSSEHGTKIAGIIGAKGDNNEGVAGICWNASLVSLRNDLNISKIIEAIEYATDNDIELLNLSQEWSSTTFNTSFLSALDNYNGLLICSAGNDAMNVDSGNIHRYPTKYSSSKIISVAATLENGSMHSSSNYGITSVDLGAPGNLIKTTSTSGGYTQGGYTSMAAPHVTGVAALIKSRYPELSNFGIRAAILESVVPSNYLTGKVATGGKLNAYNALADVENHTYTLIYDKNSGSGSNMPNTTVIYGIKTELRNNSYVKPGYKFKGWIAHRSSDNKWFYTNGASSGWYVEGTQPSGYYKYVYGNKAKVQHTTSVRNDTVTMYAQWQKVDFTLVYNTNGGNENGGMANQVIHYGVNTPLSQNVFSRTGYEFSGWTAHRSSDNKWFYTNGVHAGWYIEGNQPSNYVKYHYPDQAIVSQTSSINGDIVNMYAQWSVKLGDVNQDGNISVADISMIQLYLSEIIQLSDDQLIAADFNQDGLVDMNDVLDLQIYISN